MGTQIFDSQIKDSIALTGTPTAPTPSVDDDSTRIATTEFVHTTLTAKILGTVSQVGGVPTGAVIESGSNANGYYVKFADGTMICQKLVTTGNIETAWGTLYQSGSSPVGTFPAAFIVNPYCNMMWTQGAGGLAIPAMSGGAWSATTGPSVAIIRPTSHPYAGTVYITAIGRWF